MSEELKPEFITERTEIKGTQCSFQIAFIKQKWAIRIIDHKENKVIKVAELKKISSTYITHVIQDIIGRKFGEDVQIDEMDLGGKMAELLKQINDFQK
ncbi:MAG: hypothetical protein HWN67_12610 [Candidatus Helarchaeota archaeon]|nr:hypothetical protein [Candidatus Helarchaeota archaeon]